MWTIVFLLANVIWNKVDGRYIDKIDKGHATSADKEFAKLEKRQQITGELEVNGQRFESLGCWRDAWARGLPSLEGEHYLLMDPNYKGRSHALFKCARAAGEKGLKVFGIENGGQCFASAVGEKRYRKYGPSKDCKGDGKGGPWSIQVYRFVDPDKTINGDYSEWSPWTECSKTCSGGVRRRMRKCSSPPPSNGGRDCRSLGPSVESQDCNVKLCSGKFAVGDPESHSARFSNGGQVRQLEGAGNSPNPPNQGGRNVDRNEDKYSTDVRYTEKLHGAIQQNSFDSNGNAKKVEGKYIPMSREDIKNFKQVASFQNSVSDTTHGLKNSKTKDTSKSPGVPNTNNPVEGNAFKQPTPFSRKPLPLTDPKRHPEVLSESSKPAVHGAASWKDVSSIYASSSASVGSPPRKQMGLVKGSFQLRKTKELSRNDNSVSGAYKKLGEALKQSDDRSDGRLTVSPTKGEANHINSNKMTAAEKEQNSKYITLISTPLNAMKPDIVKQNAAEDNNQDYKFSQHYSDNRLGNNNELETKPNAQNAPTHFSDYRKMGNHPQDADHSKPPATYKEHLENSFTDSSHESAEGSSSSLPSSSKSKQTTTPSSKADSLKGQEIKEPSVTALQQNPVMPDSKVKAMKEVEGMAQPKLSDKESQEQGKKPGEASREFEPGELQGPISQHGEQVDNSNSLSSMKGSALSMNKVKPVVEMSPQQVQTSPRKEDDGGPTLQQKYPQQEHVLSKLTPATGGNKLHQTTEGNTNGKSESDQGQQEEEGEPVPMMDLSKAGTLGGTEFGQANGEEFQGPEEETGMQSQPNGAVGDDYGPGNGEVLASPSDDTQPMPDASQQSRPVYDNEAIQGISDLAHNEDQNILQQVNSNGQAGSYGNMGTGYDEASMAQAYTGGSHGVDSDDEIEHTQDEVKQKSNSSLAGNGRSRDRDNSEAHLTSDYYNTEPTEDCLCPKKECSAKADVAFLVDGSANIPQPYYARVLEFIKIFSRGFDKRNTHVGLMAYGDGVKTALDLKGLSDFKQLDDAVNIAPYIGGKAYTGNALLQMKTSLFAISGRQDAPRALILFSSGGSADDVVAPGEELRDSGVKVTAIGLGKQANVRELINVASEPKSEHVFTAFLDTLPNAMDEIIKGVCRDVMGIVRDRQVPCTCETYNGQIGPSSDSSKASSESEAEPTGSNPQQESDLSYSQSNEQSKNIGIPYYQNEEQSHHFASQDSYLHDNDTEESQPTEASRRPEHDGHLSISQEGGQANGASEKPVSLISNGYHLSEKDSRNGQQSQNYGTSAGEMNHGDTQQQEFRLSVEHHESEENDQSREDEENEIGTDDYSKDSEGGRKFDNGEQNSNLKNDSYPSNQEHIQISEVHRFAGDFPEHYKPHINTGADNVDESGEKSVSQDYSNNHANKQFSKVDDTLQEILGPQGDSSQSATFSHEKFQGSGSQVHPAFTPSASVNNYGPFRQPNYHEGYSKAQGELPSDFRVPTKVIAVGKAAENYDNEVQEKDRHGCGKVHLGVVLDSSSPSQGSGKQQATKMMDLAKQVSHLFPVSPEGNSIGMVVYGGSPQPSVVHFDRFLDQKSMDQAIDNASNPSFEIKIGKALTLAQEHLFSPIPTSKHNVLLLVTDGSSTDDVSRPAIELKRRGIEVFCLGVGRDVNKTQLDVIASEPAKDHVFLAPFNDEDTLMEKIQNGICQSANRSVAARLQTQRKCPSDLGFVIDGARSIEVLGKGNFKKMLDFVKNVSLGFHISPEETRVGAITYGTEPIIAIPFSRYTSARDLALAIENITYPGTVTMTGKALALANQKLFDKGSRINVPKVLVVLTEGTSRDKVQPSAQALHKAGVTVISVGLGPVYNTSQLNNVASMPAAYHVIKTRFNQLQNKVNELQDKICQAKQKRNEHI